LGTLSLTLETDIDIDIPHRTHDKQAIAMKSSLYKDKLVFKVSHTVTVSVTARKKKIHLILIRLAALEKCNECKT
jgi:hypothetical protein